MVLLTDPLWVLTDPLWVLTDHPPHGASPVRDGAPYLSGLDEATPNLALGVFEMLRVLPICRTGHCFLSVHLMYCSQ